MCHCLNVSSEFFKIPGVINGKTSEQLLKMLNDEENKRREELIKMRQMRRVPVKKDW